VVGERWLATGKSPAWEALSAVVPHECNYLLKPDPPLFDEFETEELVPIPLASHLRRRPE
jgi:hypothetical protein